MSTSLMDFHITKIRKQCGVLCVFAIFKHRLYPTAEPLLSNGSAVSMQRESRYLLTAPPLDTNGLVHHRIHLQCPTTRSVNFHLPEHNSLIFWILQNTPLTTHFSHLCPRHKRQNQDCKEIRKETILQRVNIITFKNPSPSHQENEQKVTFYIFQAKKAAERRNICNFVSL